MSPLIIYLPEQTIRGLRAGARRARKSVSAYVAEILGRRDPSAEWPKDFCKLYGSCRGELLDIDEQLPEVGS